MSESSSRYFRILIYVCFFLSGAASLIYEVVWARHLGLFLGITSLAHTAVITAFMAGLAAGSMVFGRIADRNINPFRLYAWLEFAIAAYAAATPWLFPALQAAYTEIAGTTGVTGTSAQWVRVGIALVALLLPTFLMGGTLPLLVRGVTTRLPHLGATTSRLYGLNTLGAMTGTLLAGYVLIYQLGIRGTIFTGVALNVLVGWVVLQALPAGQGVEAADSGVPPGTPAAAANTEATRRTRLFIVLGFGAAGFASLLTQMAWIRAMVLLVGGSVYAFTITLSCFLAGIGIGSLVYRRVFQGGPDEAGYRRMPHAAAIAGVIGATILVGIPLLAKLPEWYLTGYSAGLYNNFALFQGYIFFLAFMLMVLPTLFMGLLFPLVTVIWTDVATATGRGVGAAYAVNTVGTILGALLGGLFVLPALGIQNSLMLAAGIYIVVAGVFWWYAGNRLSLGARAGLPVFGLLLLAAGVWLIPPWDRVVWGNGVYYRPDYAAEEIKTRDLHDIMSECALLYYAEGLDGTVAVCEGPEQRYLVINGKTDATSMGDLDTQLMLGLYPALLHQEAKNAMIIGLGSGITASAVAGYPAIENITVLEMQPEVVEASDYFRPENRDVLDDPRVNVVTADARNFVLAEEREWDIIISEPSNPWISGVSNLFTEDFFRMAKQRLAPGGIMTQWFHAYSMSEQDMRMVLNTFSSMYRYVTVWNIQSGDLLMIGSDTRYSFDHERFREFQRHPVVGEDLRRAGISELRDLVRNHLMDNAAVRQYTQGSGLNTDNDPSIEFNAPKYFYADTTSANLRSVISFLDSAPLSVPVDKMALVRGNTIEIDPMRVDVVFDDISNVSAIQARWTVWRELRQNEEGRVDRYWQRATPQLEPGRRSKRPGGSIPRDVQ